MIINDYNYKLISSNIVYYIHLYNYNFISYLFLKFVSILCVSYNYICYLFHKIIVYINTAYQDLLDYAVNVCSRVSKENVLIPLPVTGII